MCIDLWFSLYSEKHCPALVDPSNGEVVVMSNRVDGVARYFCDNGHRLVGAATRKCQSNERWSESEPTCNGKSNKTYLTLT